MSFYINIPRKFWSISSKFKLERKSFILEVWVICRNLLTPPNGISDYSGNGKYPLLSLLHFPCLVLIFHSRWTKHIHRVVQQAQQVDLTQKWRKISYIDITYWKWVRRTSDSSKIRIYLTQLTKVRIHLPHLRIVLTYGFHYQSMTLKVILWVMKC